MREEEEAVEVAMGGARRELAVAGGGFGRRGALAALLIREESA